VEHSRATIRIGLTRRGLLKLCPDAASLLAMPASPGPVMAAALATRKRRPVIWLSFQECTGCTESLTRAHAPTLEQLMLELLSLAIVKRQAGVPVETGHSVFSLVSRTP